jgi:hypothetical protein
MCLPVSIFGQSGVDHVVKVGIMAVPLVDTFLVPARFSLRKDDMTPIIKQEPLWSFIRTGQTPSLLVLVHQQEASVKLM